MEKYDIIVVGSGPGGYVAAIRAAQLGKKVAVVEKAELGGVCLNWGCIPTKALLKSAQVLQYASHAAAYGVNIEGAVKPDMEKIIARSRGVADTMSKGVKFLLDKNKVDIICGTGKLDGPGRIQVLSAGGEVSYFEAEHIILAAGARPRDLPGVEVNGVNILNSKQTLVFERIPRSVAVIGSGAIGCEFAYLYAALGAKVTVIEYLPRLLPLEDEEVSKYMERSFRKLKATVMTSAAVKNVVAGNNGDDCTLEVETKKGIETVNSEIVLSAVGIKTNLDGLGLESVGIEPERDKIPVDEYYRTAAEGVYAIGDLVCGPALAHVASSEALCCVEKICGKEPDPIDYSVVPACIYTTPEVASVGITEQQAIEKGIVYRVGKFPFTASGKATAAGDRDGFVKLIFSAETDKLLGAHLVGANVTEMISELALALKTGATSQTIIETIHPHPTMSEGVLEAAEASHGLAVHI